MELQHTIIGIICIISSFTTTQAVQCYHCGYIEEMHDLGLNLNSECYKNVHSGTVHFEEGLACMKAEGMTVDGKPFLIRRAFLQGFQRDVSLDGLFPDTQGSYSCDSIATLGGELADDGLAVTIVGNTPVATVTSCLLCHDRDECNAAVRHTMTLGIAILLAFLPFIF